MLELRQHLWPNTPKADDPASEVDTWAQILARYPAEDVVTAMRSTRKPFAPALGEIEQALDPWPSPDEVWGEFSRLLARGYSTHTLAVPWSSKAVHDIARAGYWRRFGDAPDPTFDEFAAANLANFRKAWIGEVAGALAHDRRVRAGLAPGEGRAISEPHPAAIDAAAVLPSLP